MSDEINRIKKRLHYKWMSRIWNIEIPDTRPKKQIRQEEGLEFAKEVVQHLKSRGFKRKLVKDGKEIK